MCAQGHTEETAYNTDILLFVKIIEVGELNLLFENQLWQFSSKFILKHNALSCFFPCCCISLFAMLNIATENRSGCTTMLFVLPVNIEQPLNKLFWLISPFKLDLWKIKNSCLTTFTNTVNTKYNRIPLSPPDFLKRCSNLLVVAVRRNFLKHLKCCQQQTDHKNVIHKVVSLYKRGVCLSQGTGYLLLK